MAIQHRAKTERVYVKVDSTFDPRLHMPPEKIEESNYMLGLLSLYFNKPLILINRQLDKQTKQMVCGYALGHYLEHQLLMDLHTLNKFLTIKDKHILLYEHNAFTSHLMLDSDEVYQMTKRGLDAAQISVTKRILNRRFLVVDHIDLSLHNIDCNHLMILAQKHSQRKPDVSRAGHSDFIISHSSVLPH